MDYRDRGRGELARHEHQPSEGWGDEVPLPQDPYSQPGETYRTPSRRRARHRGAPEPVDTYTPSWARESAPPPEPIDRWQSGRPTEPWQSGSELTRSDDGGHHRFDTPPEGRRGRRRAEPDGDRLSTDSRWQSTETTSGWQPTTQTGWHGAPATGGPTPVPGRHADDALGGWTRGALTGDDRAGYPGAAATGDDRAGYPGDRPGRAGGRRRRADREEQDAASAAGDWPRAGSADREGRDSRKDRASPEGRAGRGDRPTRDWTRTEPAAGWTADGGSDAGERVGRRRRDPTGDATADVGAGHRERIAPGRRPTGDRQPGQPDQWQPGEPDRWDQIIPGQRQPGEPDGWDRGQPGRRGSGEPDGWDRGQPGRRGSGEPDRWTRDEPDRWDRGQPDRWTRDEPDRWDRTDPGQRDRPAGRRSRDRFTEPGDRPGDPGRLAIGPGPRDQGMPPAADRRSASAPPPALTPPALNPAALNPAAPNQVAPGQPAPGQPASDRPAPGQPGPDRPLPDHPARPAVRWARSPDEVGKDDGGHAARPASGGPGGSYSDAGRRRRAPDAEPIRRYADNEPVRGYSGTGPVRGYGDAGPGRRRRDTGQPDRNADTAQWDRATETGTMDRIREPGPAERAAGLWDRAADASGWDQFTDTGTIDRFTDTTEWSRDELVGVGPDDSTGGDPAIDRETFWSGTRLAGDDPRWTDTPASAPRSPAIAYPVPPASRQATPTRGRAEPATPTRRRAEPATPTRGRAEPASPGRGRAGSAAASRRRAEPSAPTRRRLATSTGRRQGGPLSRRLEDDLLDAQPSGPLTAVLYAAAWYAVPVLVFLIWVLTLDASVPSDCVTDATGGGCQSERAQAISSLLGGGPRFAVALLSSLVVAVLLRWASSTWRAATVGLAAAVVGGGLSTVIFSVVTGRSLG